MMKKMLSLCLAVCLLLGCALSAGAEGVSYPLDGGNEPLTILMGVEGNAPNAGYANWNETEFIKTWIEKSGVNFTVKEVADNAAIVLNLASGEYPDMVMAYENYYNGGLTAMINDELAVSLTQYADYMPDYLAALDLDPSYRPYVTYTDGNIYFFANLIEPGNITTHWRGMVVRQDFLDKLNMKAPTTNQEFHDMLVAFKEQLGCEIPLCGNWWKNVLVTDGFCSTEYGLVSGERYQVDGKYHYGAYEEGYRGLMGYLNQLYTEGLLDPNFQTTDEPTSQASLLSGQTGAHPTSCARINTIWARSENPEFKLAGLGSLNGSDGTTAYFTQTDTLTPSRANAYVTADCKQPELAVALFNWLYTDEGKIISNFGPEGLCWTPDENGNPVLTEYMTKNENGLSLDQMLYVHTMGNRPELSLSALSLQRFAMPEQLAAMQTWDKTQSRTYLLPSYSVLDADAATEATALWTDISTYISESTAKFITGEKNLEGDFDAYLAQLKSMGMDRYIEIQQNALDAYYGK